MRSLRVIQRGGVRVDLNTNLCYVRTVNWSYIVGNQTAAAAPIRLLTNRLICPDTCQPQYVGSSIQAMTQVETKRISLREKDSKPSHCWSSSHVQSICSTSCSNRGLACRVDNVELCCHVECLAGCYDSGPGACVACKGALHHGICVSKCPEGTYLFHGRRCVSAAECFNMSSGPRLPSVLSSSSSVTTAVDSTSTTTTGRFAIYQGRCVPDCPSGHQRNEASGECLPCGDKCPIIRCHSMLISSLKSLSKLKDCYSVTDLYISIHEGDPALIKQRFDEAFSSLREVKSIKVIRASALTSLAFLRHVRRINTNPSLPPNTTVLEIRGNDNLVELWPPPSQNDSLSGGGGLRVVSEGLVHFILNRYLCPQKIIDLVKSGALILPGGRNFRSEELELAQATNGKLGFCETTQIVLQLKEVFSTTAIIQWPRVFSSRPTGQTTSTFVLVFFQATTKNLTAYSSRLSCGDDSWKMIPSVCNASVVQSVLSDGVAFCSKTIGQLKPATRYAVYVESKPLFSQRGAISNIIYFTTKPSNPSPPRLERLQALNDSKILVKWLPPLQSNGRLAVYALWFRATHVDPEPYLLRDFCFSTPDWLSSSISPSHYVGLSRLTGIFWSVVKQGVCDTQQCKVNGFHRSLWMVDSHDATLPVVFGNRLSRTLGDGEVGLVVVNADSDAEPSEALGLQPQINKKSFSYTLSNLRSFSQYVVELQACQQPDEDSDFPWRDLMIANSNVVGKPGGRWDSYLWRYCSHRVFKTQRTLPNAGADDVNVESIKSEQDSAGTVYVSWAEPPNPNGVILYYVLRYRRVEKAAPKKAGDVDSQPIGQNKSDGAKPSASSSWSTLCVSRANWQSAGVPGGSQRHLRLLGKRNASAPLVAQNLSLGGAELLNLLPGFYELQIMAVSLAGNSSWTAQLLFEVKTSPRDKIIMVAAICVAVLSVLMTSVIACIIHRVRKKRLMDSEWQSPNPEYWHVYEVDDWEMRLEDIDTLNFRHPLGRGNFGMVYRGVVKTLRTPARCFYPQPYNIPVAIKTLSSTSTVFDRRDFITEACYMKQFQSFHVVRLFGVVSKSSPPSAFRASRRGGGDGLQKRFRLNLRRLFGGALSCSRRQTSRQAVPVPIRKRPLGFSSDETVPEVCENAGSHTPPHPLVSTTSSSKIRGPESPVGGVNGPAAKQDGLRSGWFPQGILSSAVQKCSSTDSIKLFSQYGLFVVMELMENGDLASYLRELGDSGIGFVKPVQAYLWAVQIADGMAYLERKKYVHRDLAARNCLVDGRGVVKIGDFGLCRDIYERNYYHKVGAGKLPVRWMAPESLQSAYFTSRSDVWSFGVVLWEIATMACLPYQGMSHEEVIAYVLDGNTLVSGGAPINCPPLLQSVMLYCWAYRPAQRPTFLHLLFLLAPRFADADFRQASYFYVGDTLTQQPPPYQDLENSFSSNSSSAAGFSDLPNLIKTVLGPPHLYHDNESGGSNTSLSDGSPPTSGAPASHLDSTPNTQQRVTGGVDRCSLDDADTSSC
ncbi:unnamed protein product [Mesocestoides corti]|uniref:receptor protein-tyrosine kinase n=1 Tax=Mesocestoides corti TaxID=53468 RepID=A0A3P6HE37_MESCO|nr:unnamed protein product [Mesocestoides corti]